MTDADVKAASLADLAAAEGECTRCPLYLTATQAVPGEGGGEGGRGARLMLVGEQPGDREDLAGRPFVGPAGQVLDRALGAAGIPRAQVFVTNAVKHFKFTPRGKRRLHSRPDAGEIDACQWWLAQELRLVGPAVVVALGARALRGLTGRAVPVSSLRGKVQALAEGPALVATVHPSWLLRLRDGAARDEEERRFTADLARAWRLAVDGPEGAA